MEIHKTDIAIILLEISARLVERKEPKAQLTLLIVIVSRVKELRTEQ
jgi:hypothetical protein